MVDWLVRPCLPRRRRRRSGDCAGMSSTVRRLSIETFEGEFSRAQTFFPSSFFDFPSADQGAGCDAGMHGAVLPQPVVPVQHGTNGRTTDGRE